MVLIKGEIHGAILKDREIESESIAGALVSGRALIEDQEVLVGLFPGDRCICYQNGEGIVIYDSRTYDCNLDGCCPLYRVLFNRLHTC